MEECLGDGEDAVDMENAQMDAWALARTACARHARRRNNKGQQKDIDTTALYLRRGRCLIIVLDLSLCLFLQFSC